MDQMRDLGECDIVTGVVPQFRSSEKLKCMCQKIIDILFLFDLTMVFIKVGKRMVSSKSPAPIILFTEWT